MNHFTERPMPKLGSLAPLPVSCSDCKELGAVGFGELRSWDLHEGITRFQSCLGREMEISNHPSQLTIRFVLQGSGIIELNGRRFELTPGAFVVNNRGTNYSFRGTPGELVEDCAVGFSRAYLQQVGSSLTLTEGSLLDCNEMLASLEFPEIRLNSGSMMWPLMQQLKQPAAGDMLAAALQEEILWDLCAAFLSEHRQIKTSLSALQTTNAATRVELYRRLWTAREYIESEYLSDISLVNIARVACLSPYHFLRTFKAVTGMSPYRYVLRLRLAHVKNLVTTTNLPFVLIARDSGFSDVSSFSKSFKKEFGLTPTEARSGAK